MDESFILDFDILDYKESLDLQHKLIELRINNKIPDTLILLQHPHVFTIGRRGSLDHIFDKSIPYYFVERGGDVTYHGPGQLVGYLLFDLNKLKLDVKEFVKKIENSICYALNKFNIFCDVHHALPGVWIERKKIASIGIALKNFVTFHGFALNVNTDLSYFSKIMPCGMDASVMTSMEKILGKAVPMNEIKVFVLEGISKEFNKKFKKVNVNDILTIENQILSNKAAIP